MHELRLLEVQLRRPGPLQSCPHCHAPIGRLDSDCPACGQPTGQRPPFYVYLIGAAIVLLLFVALADFPALMRFFADLGRLFRP